MQSRGPGSSQLGLRSMRRGRPFGLFRTLALTAITGCGLAATPALADTARPKTTCQAFVSRATTEAGPNKVYELQKGDCDITDMAVAVHDGDFRTLYGPEADFKPQDEAQILAILDGVDRKLRETALSMLPPRTPGQGACLPSESSCHVTLKVMMFAHGGLVGQDQAIAEGESIAPGAMADGYVPIFLIWNSDLVGAYSERLCCVLEGEQSKRGVPYFAPVRLLGDIAAGFARAPEYYGQQVIRFHDSVIRKSGTQYYLSKSDLSQLCDLLRASTCGHIDYPPFPTDDELNALDQPIEEQSGLYRILAPFRVGTTAIASQIGTEAWDDMVRRTRLALQPPLIDFAPAGAELPSPGVDPCDTETLARLRGLARAKSFGGPNPGNVSDGRFDVGSEGALSIFADHLACEIKQNLNVKPKIATIDVELYYYGHSMGAIVGDQLISSHPELPWRRIVYMAAADSVRDFRSTVAPLLTCSGAQYRNRCLPDDVQVYDLMLHPLAESHDLEYWGLLPEGSLLEWIDEMFGGAKSVDDRTFGKWTNVEKSMAFLPVSARRHMYFRVFPAQANMRDGDPDEQTVYAAECTTSPADPSGAKPIRCHPITHGNFTNYSFWRDGFLCDPNDKDAACPPSGFVKRQD